MTATLSPARTAADHPVRPRSIAPLLAVGTVWFTAALLAGRADVFQRDVGEPPVKLAVAVGVPVLGVGLALLAVPRFRAWAEGLDLRLLVSLQGWRVLGFAFLVGYAQGVLPGAFAWPAAIGDLLVGLAAPLVAVHLRRSAFYGLMAAGIADFVLALALGVANNIGARGVLPDGTLSQAPIYELPLSLIPTFAVPFLFVVHLLALARARRGR